MAVIDKTSSWYSIRGKVGGLLVSSNAQASYIRAVRPPAMSATPSQTVQRSEWSSMFGIWRSLGSTIQGLWNTAAAGPDYVRLDWYGQPYHMSGLNLFFSLNRVTRGAFGTTQIGPPISAAPNAPPVSTFALRSSTGLNDCTWTTTGAWHASIAALRLMAHASFNGSQLSSQSSPKLVRYWLRSISSPASIRTQLETSFGALPLSYRMFFTVESVSSEGRLSAAVRYDVASLGT